jgi:hypothetical protein
MTLVHFTQRIWQFHEDPCLIEWVQTPVGRLGVWLVATLLLLPVHDSFLVPLLLGLVMVWPERRLLILLVASPLVGLELVSKPLHELLHTPDALVSLATAIPAAALILVFVILSIVAARNFQRLPPVVRRHPLLSLHVLTWILILASWQVPPEGIGTGAWKVLTLAFNLLPFLVWRACYIMLSGQRGSAKETTFADHMFYALPVFGGTNVPYGKGFDYLKRCRAADPQALARSHLAGLKLLVLVWLWRLVRGAILAIAHGHNPRWVRVAEEYGWASIFSLELPRLEDLIAANGSSDPALLELWLSLFFAFILQVLDVAIKGHIIIGALRLLGRNVFRNTYKPLLAESIVEFWNRFYYYFKELLVEFFFYPVYARYFRSHQNLRIFVATMAAACVGNTYYHVLRDNWVLEALSWSDALEALAPRAFYTLLLGLGIYCSMIAERRRRGRPPPANRDRLEPLHRIRRIAGVWLFFALIGIWNTHGPAAEFGTRTSFFFSLFGLDLDF